MESITELPDKVHQQLRALSRDPRLDELEMGIGRANIFRILKAENLEIRHSNFLAWLLSPNETHKLGSKFLKLFLKDIFANGSYVWTNEFRVDRLALDNATVRREWQNIDIVVEADDFVVAIENKIHSTEHSNQLRKYRNTIETHFPSERFNHVFVYLTLDGSDALDKEDADYYQSYSYVEIAKNIERLLEIQRENIGNRIQTYIEDYNRTIRLNLMKNDQLNQLARDLYDSHKESIDFIFENRPDRLFEVSKIVQEQVTSTGWALGSQHKGYIRFLPPRLLEIMPRTAEYGWPDREAMLFEFICYYDKCQLVLTIAPGNKEIVEFLVHNAKVAVKGLKGSREPKGKKWITPYIRNWKKNIKAPEMTDEEVKQYLDTIWAEVQIAVERVENTFEACSSELIRLGHAVE